MNKKIIILIIITSILAIAFMGIMIKMIKENGQCLDDPFTYSAKKLKESGGNYYCSCQSLDPELLDFSFSEEGIKIKKDSSLFNVGNISFTEIEGKGGNEK